MANLVTPICRKLSRGKCKSSILHIKLDFINWILPSIQPSLSQLMKAFSTLEVDVEVDFVPSLVQAHDVVLVSRSSAAASLETIIQEIPNPKQHSGQFYSWAVLQHMPRLESNKRFLRRYVPGGERCQGTNRRPAGRAPLKSLSTRSWGFMSEERLVHDPKGEHLVIESRNKS